MKHLLAVLLVLLMVGPAWGQVITWDSGFEADPASSDPVSEGHQRIKDTKIQSRLRAEVETCWGSSAVGCDGVADTGRHRQGSARIFVLPGGCNAGTLLNKADTTGSSATGNNRVCLDSDDNTLAVKVGGTWVDVSAGPLDNLTNVTAGSPVDGDLLIYDGTTNNKFESVTPALNDIQSTAMSTGDVAISTGCVTSGCNVAGASAAVVATDSGGGHAAESRNLFAIASVPICNKSGSARNVCTWITETSSGTNGQARCRRLSDNSYDIFTPQLGMNDAAAGTYTFQLRAEAESGGSNNWFVNGTDASCGPGSITLDGGRETTISAILQATRP